MSSFSLRNFLQWSSGQGFSTVCNNNHNYIQLNCASFNKSMAPVKIQNSPCWSVREFFCTVAPAGLTPEAIWTGYAEPLLQGCCTVPPHNCLCQSCFVSITNSTTLSLARVLVQQKSKQTSLKNHTLFFDTTHMGTVCVFGATHITFSFFNVYLKKPWCFNISVYCKI